MVEEGSEVSTVDIFYIKFPWGQLNDGRNVVNKYRSKTIDLRNLVVKIYY